MSAETESRRWHYDESSFQWNGAFATPTIGYKLWYYFLRFSQHYWLAHKETVSFLSVDERNSLPTDYDLVVSTYNAFGNVWKGLYRTWWEERAERLFSIAGSQPKASSIYRLPAGTAINRMELDSAITSYLSGPRTEQNSPHALLIGIPLTATKTEILNSVGMLLDDVNLASHIQPLHGLNCARLRKKELIKCLDLLWIRANEPDTPLWEIGLRLELSKSLQDDGLTLENAMSHKSKDNRTRMEKLVSAKLQHCRMIAESAARGYFPTPINLNLPEMDSNDLVNRLQDCMQREQDEAARLGIRL